MMYMKHVLLIIFCLSSLCMSKAQDVADFFVRMPNEYILQLEEAWRKDLIDLYKSGKTATLDNTINGKSTLLRLSADYLLLQSTERSTVEIKLLPLINNTNIACVVTTVHAPVADSRVDFYTMDWKLLPADDLWIPATIARFVSDSADRRSESFAEAMSLLDMELIRYRLNEENTTLTAEFTTPDYLSASEREKVKPFLKPRPVEYHWKSGRFE